jgi:hypothetical protein
MLRAWLVSKQKGVRMRRRVTMVLSLALPLVAYSLAHAQSKAAPASAASAGAAQASASAKASAPATAAASAAAAPAAAAPAAAPAASASPSAAPAPAAAVSVNMAAKPADPGMNGATYAVRLRDLEQRVDELKDQIRRSHTRLALLSDTILGGGAAGSRAEVVFKDEMSSAFLLTHALFVIDNQVQYNKQDDTGALADQKEIPIYTGSVPPGDHMIQVALTFQGNGYGVFSYLRGYKFETKTSHAFTAVEGKVLEVTVTAFEKGGVTTPLEQRPTFEWHETVKPLVAGAAAAAAASAGGTSAGAPGGASVSAGISAGGGKK